MGVRRSLALFRIQFYSICYACIRYRPLAVAPSERLTRFLFNVEHEIDKHGNCTYRAFFHSKGRPISVVRTDGMTESSLWRFGRCWIESVREKTLEGRADFVAAKLAPLGLIAQPTVPPPHHADIIGWPIDKEA